MAKNFYSAEEAAQKLNTDEAGLKKLVQGGQLREFRDAGSINYKVTDVDAIAGPDPADSASDSAMESGEIVLEPVEDSSIEFSPSGSDILSLDELDAEDTTAGTRSGASASSMGTSGGTSGGTSAIPSVGINVFDDDEDDEVDPLARTAVTDMAGLGLEGTGSGSGILDLTRESDDTSLGSELLEEIYTDGEDDDLTAGESGTGFDQADSGTAAPAEVHEEEVFALEESAEPTQRVAIIETVAYAPDAASSGLTALLFVAIIVMWFAGLGTLAAVRDVTPTLLIWIYENLMMCAGGAVLVGILAAVITYFVAKRGS